MSRFYSLGDLLSEIKTEMRVGATNPRFTDAEITIAIRRATSELSEYFWYEETDSSQSFTDGTFTYTYAYPVRDIFKVEFQDSTTSPYQISDDWEELENSEFEGSDLIFYGNHGSATIRVWYERHPYPYPDDFTGTLDDGTDTSLAPVAAGDTLDWPDDGYLRMEDEVMRYTAIDRSTGIVTVVRGALETAAAAHSSVSASFLNLSSKNVFYEGVKDRAMFYLHRMRILDAPSGDVAGNVTIMRQINEQFDDWLKRHRMRSKRPVKRKTHRAEPMRGRRRGV